MTLTPELEASLKRVAELAHPMPWDTDGKAPYASRKEFSDYITPDHVTALLDEIDKLRAMTQWQSVETAPKDTKTMFAVIAMRVDVGSIGCYDSDPWCVWSEKGSFIRWPHKFPPTHWMPLPSVPKTEEV